MGIMVYFLLGVMQDVYHQPYHLCRSKSQDMPFSLRAFGTPQQGLRV